MKRLPLIGIVLLLFGLINLLWYLPISFGVTLKNTPFPFPHLKEVIPHEGGGTGIEIRYLPIENAIQDPYWLVWSLALYGGIIILSIIGIKSAMYSWKNQC